MVGSQIAVATDGLAAGEPYTLRLNGKAIGTGKADKRGEVNRSFVLPKTTPEGALPLTLTGSNPNRVGTATLNVIKPKTLSVEVAEPELSPKQQQTVTITGLAPGEAVTLMYAGAKLTTGKADASGLFTFDFNVGKKAGEKTVKAIGSDPSRSGEVTFTVRKKDGSSGGGGGGGDDPPGGNI